ncbi:hypothetical protein [Nonomuraea sp. NPDC049158]|uniref:hypothetical protein n=1 Tax=Nonomuraea sp. NPDC049158 TaxID=3155649 RepID=UPI0033FE7DD5
MIDLRRKLYPEPDGYRTEDENKRILQQFADRFSTGELLFEAPWVVRMTQRMSKSLARKGYPPYWTAIRDRREIERWNPRFRYIENVPFTSLFAKIPVRVYRVTYRLMNTFPASRDNYRMFRFSF